MRAARRFGTFLLTLSLALTAVELTSLTAAQALKPTVLAFLPLTGPVGTSVTITGTGFQDSSPATSVRFNGTAASFTIDSGIQITATVPVGATTGKITVTDAQGTGTSLVNFTVTAPPTPVVAAFLPLSGVIGTSVGITGTGFTGASSVTFGGHAATFDVVSDLHIDAVVPTDATTGPVALTTPGGVGTSLLDFTVTAPPTPVVAAFLPLSGLVGTSVTITGTGFTGASSVTFGGHTASFDVVSDLQIDAVVPNDAITGPVAVSTPGGDGTSLLDFTVVVPTSHGRSVGLRLRRHLRAIGSVNAADGFGLCETNSTVKIQRRRDHGGWRTVRRVHTDSNGRYRAPLIDRPGRYRSMVPRSVFNTGLDVCSRAISRIRVRG